jgi:CDP-diacylglycerol--glycerol-3-phosphate 3-phosphatidyltransferase
LNAPNLLSTARILLTPAAMAAILADERVLAVVVVGVALATDVADGWVARRRGESTRLGKILDPVADKVFAAGVLGALIQTGRVSPVFALVIVSRDVCLLAAGWWAVRRGAAVPVANVLGKIAYAILGVYLLGAVLGIGWPGETAAAVGSVYVLAGLSYARRGPRSTEAFGEER